MRPQNYKTLDGEPAHSNSVAWYWRLVATSSTFMILGGFLMLPTTFDRSEGLRVSRSVVGIFAVALLTAGFSFTALLCFAVRNLTFQAESIFSPVMSACAIGLLTVFYDFLISSKYQWNVPALLVIVAACLGTIIYGGLLFYTHRKIRHTAQAAVQPSMIMHHSPPPPTTRPESINSGTGLWQDPMYYENYVRNMFPASSHSAEPLGYDPSSITEEEMQRQQMLMLLLQREPAAGPDSSQSTFHIDWQGQEVDEAHGYYAPQSAYPQSAHTPRTGISRQWTSERLRPWDGVFREATVVRGRSESGRGHVRAHSQETREARRREIELGGRR